MREPCRTVCRLRGGGCSASKPAPAPRDTFVDPEAIFDALEQAGTDATLLLRASWLKTQDGAGDRLIKRGDPLPPEATIGVAELRSIWRGRKLHNGKKTALPFLTLSQCANLFFVSHGHASHLLLTVSARCDPLSASGARSSTQTPTVSRCTSSPRRSSGAGASSKSTASATWVSSSTIAASGSRLERPLSRSSSARHCAH